MIGGVKIVLKSETYRIETATALLVPDYLIDHLRFQAPEEIHGRHGGVAGAVEVKRADGSVDGVLAYFPSATLRGLCPTLQELSPTGA